MGRNQTLSTLTTGQEFSIAVSGSFSIADIRAALESDPNVTVRDVNTEASATGVFLTWNGAEIDLADASNIVTSEINANYGSAAGIGTPSGSPNGPNMGAFLNSVGDAIRKALTNFKVCDFLKTTFGVDVCAYWWVPFAFLLVIVLGVVFFLQASKGFGEGIATRA